MNGRDYLCLFQAIRLPYKGKPLRVLEEKYLGASECSLDKAKEMFKTRFEDKNYSRKHGAIWPDAVRFLNERSEEILRYTAWEYFKESKTRESDTVTVA